MKITSKKIRSSEPCHTCHKKVINGFLFYSGSVGFGNIIDNGELIIEHTRDNRIKKDALKRCKSCDTDYAYLLKYDFHTKNQPELSKDFYKFRENIEDIRKAEGI